jgi:acyl transferase domain-containing protein/phosphopantetheinyl transferase/acyl carrier protein
MISLAHPTGSSGQVQQGDIAIIGMSCIFPGAPDLQTYWRNIVSKVDAIGDPPEDWEADLVYDPGSQENDRIYCKRGGYLGDLAHFDPLQYGVMPSSIDGGEPDHFLALRVAHEALADAGYFERPIDGERVEVILGRGTYINRGYTTLVQHGLVIDQTLQILKQLHPEHTEAELQAIKRELKASQPPFNAEVAPALVPNIVSGRIANRLDFRGANYTVDAACASSLIAVERGMQDLLSRRCDLALVGGVHASTPAPILMIFCQLNALSRRGQIRPFDQDADGTLLGEGVGIIVLKRREDAERDGDRVYALLKGIGTASDGRALGLLAPRLEGEILALRRAYEATGISPRTVELIEAHGTGTPVGDLTEIQALSQVFGPRQAESPWCAVGSVKSMISHLIPASGVAGLIKTALALYHKVLPPTLNCDEPNAKFELEKTPFYINTATRPWIHGAPTPRRAGVNAFGFGGINAHAILEEHIATYEDGVAVDQHHWDTEVCILQGESRQGLIRQCEQLKTYLASAPQVELKDLAYTLNAQLEEPYRLAIVAPSLQEVEQKLTYALRRLADPQCTRIKEVSGIYFFEAPLSRQGKLAFLFPGEGSQYVNMLSDLCIHFPEVRAWFDLIDQALITHQRNYLPSQVIFPPPTGKGRLDHAGNEKRLWQMDCGAEVVFTANQALFTLLSRLQLQPQAVLGHSTGEYSAFFASGTMLLDDEAQLIQHILDLNGIYEQLLMQGEIPEGSLIAIGTADRDFVLSLIEQFDGRLYMAMDNCPQQIVLYGTASVIAKAVEQLQSRGAICAALPFSRAYHTPLFTPFCRQLDGFFRHVRIVVPKLEVYSCATARPYPNDPSAIRRLAAEQWSRPVRFRETIETMYAAGIRIFVEVGPRGNLTAFVDNILRGRPYLAVAANVARKSGISQLNHLVGLLAVHGVPMQLEYLYARRAPQQLAFDKGEKIGKSRASANAMRLAMGLQPLRLRQDYLQSKADDRAASYRTSQSPVVASTTGVAVEQEMPAGDAPAAWTLAPASNAQPRMPAAQSASGQTRGCAVSAQTTPGSDPPHAHSLRSQLMQEYLSTMERFLSVQQEVMQAFMNGVEVAPASTSAVEEIGAESLPLRHERQGIISTAPGAPAGPLAGLSAEQDQAHQRLETMTVERTIEAGRVEEDVPLVTANGSRRTIEAIDQTLRRLISEKTGYPIEMLDPTLNLEADLGIDSIKRVEILGALQQQTGWLQARDIDRVTGLKTLQQIIEFFAEREQEQGGSDVSPSQPSSSSSPLGPSRQVASLPFMGTITSFIPGEELVARYQLDLAEDLFLRDHTLGGRVSMTDETLRALPVVPLTISMEMLAEAATALLPNKLLLGMKDIRAYRWIALDENRLTLELTARRKPAGAGEEVEVWIKECADPTTSKGHPGTPIIEGTVVFGDCYPVPHRAGEFSLRSAHPSKWTPEQLYTEGMFHGPCFQGVVSVDCWGEDGLEATLKTLSTEGFFRSIPDVHFLTAPVLLDAAGQLVGYWTAEHLETGFNVFPFRVAALHLYGLDLLPGTLAKCRARISLTDASLVRSDIDVIGPDGHIFAQLIGWEDRRFDLPSKFYRLRISPRDVYLSEPWTTPIARFSKPEAFTCCLLAELSDDFLTSHGKIWQRVLAHLVLSRWEREVWRGLQWPEKRKTEWLLGRVAAKDAVRLFLQSNYGMELPPADIEIAHDRYGQPLVRGVWTEECAQVPLVSLAHTAGIAVAIAGHDGQCRGIGVDIEPLERRREGFESVAFMPEERSLLGSLDAVSQEEWVLRLWCAKEAMAKALGCGMMGEPRSFIVQELDAGTGIVQITLSGRIAEQFPELHSTRLMVSTARERDLIVASSCY